ncbi:glycosyltransferase family 2 protein [Candidatus Peribacteria bacterium]|nr:glycosyltransferase family 2 protein [Candidatus Peribacteria bacterium]
MTPLVSAIILNYRTGRDAWKCANALLKQTVADRIELFIVDNHSDDDSMGYLRNRIRASHAPIRIFETSRNIGYGRGNNFGVRSAQGEFILIINPDNELEPTGLERMVKKMEDEPDIGILAPQLVHEDGTVRDSYRTFPTLLDLFIKRTPLRSLFPGRMKRYLQHGMSPSVTREVDWVAGACFLMRTSFYRELGGFDPRFFLFFEDTDLCRRSKQAGRRVLYFPEVRAQDRKHRLSEGGVMTLLTKKTARIHVLSALKYFWKWRMASY